MERSRLFEEDIINTRIISVDDVNSYKTVSVIMQNERGFSFQWLSDEGDTVMDDSGIVVVEPGQKVVVIRGTLEQISKFDQAVEEIRGKQDTSDTQE